MFSVCVCLFVLLTLPEGEEDDRFDHEELEQGAVGVEQVPGGEVEEEEGVERQADREVIDDGHIQVPTGHTGERERERHSQLSEQCQHIEMS